MSCADCSPPHNCEPCSMELTIKELKEENDKLLLKETKTHNENVSLKSEIEKLEKAHARLTTHFARNAELEEQVKELQTTIHNIKKFWLDEDDENFSVAGAVQAMEDSSKDLDNAEGQNEIDREEIVKLKKDNEELKNRWRPPLGATNFGEVLGEKYDEIKKLKEELKEWEGDGEAELDKMFDESCWRYNEDTGKKMTMLESLKDVWSHFQEQLETERKIIKLGWDAGFRQQNDCAINEFQGSPIRMFEEALLTIKKLKEKNECLDKAVRYEHSSCYDGRMMLVKTLWGEGEEYKDKIDANFETINKKIAYLKEENKTLKDVMENQQSIRDEYEKEMREIKIAMGCDGPLSWDIKDILKWIDRAKCYTGGPSQADADYEKLVDNSNNDNLVFGDIIYEHEEEIKRLTEAHLEMKVKQLSQKKEIKRLTKTLQLAEDKIKDFKDEDDCRPDAWDAM